MKKLLIFFMIPISIMLVSFLQTDHKNTAVTMFGDPDTVFVMKAASSSMMEIELGRYVAERAKHARVKAFAEMMVRDHTKANTELAAVVRNKPGFRIPDSMLPKHQRHVEHLKGNDDADELEKKYIRMMVEAHKDDIEDFEETSKEGQDADIRAFAAKQLPVLRMHRDSAMALRKVVKDDD